VSLVWSIYYAPIDVILTTPASCSRLVFIAARARVIVSSRGIEVRRTGRQILSPWSVRRDRVAKRRSMPLRYPHYARDPDARCRSYETGGAEYRLVGRPRGGGKSRTAVFPDWNRSRTRLGLTFGLRAKRTSSTATVYAVARLAFPRHARCRSPDDPRHNP